MVVGIVSLMLRKWSESVNKNITRIERYVFFIRKNKWSILFTSHDWPWTIRPFTFEAVTLQEIHWRSIMTQHARNPSWLDMKIHCATWSYTRYMVAAKGVASKPSAKSDRVLLQFKIVLRQPQVRLTIANTHSSKLTEEQTFSCNRSIPVLALQMKVFFEEQWLSFHFPDIFNMATQSSCPW